MAESDWWLVLLTAAALAFGLIGGHVSVVVGAVIALLLWGAYLASRRAGR